MDMEGEVQGVYQRNDKFAVAVKCINDSKNEVELKYFLEEIKIMRAIDPNVNLVSMIGRVRQTIKAANNCTTY